jgi:hypothetical protein
LLSSTVGGGDAASKDDAMRQAIEDIELEIGNLRGIITDLRPSLLDDLGLLPAIEALLDRRRDAGLEIASELVLPDHDGDNAELAPELGRPSELVRVAHQRGQTCEGSNVRVFVGLRWSGDRRGRRRRGPSTSMRVRQGSASQASVVCVSRRRGVLGGSGCVGARSCAGDSRNGSRNGLSNRSSGVVARIARARPAS